MSTEVQAARAPMYRSTNLVSRTRKVLVPEVKRNPVEDAALLDKVLSLTRQKRTIQAAQYLSVKHALPRTRIHRTILLENKSQERHLDMNLERLNTRQGRYNTNYEISRRAFIDQQQRKQGTWKQQDETRCNAMNFPTLRADARRRSSVDVLYRSPQYSAQEKVEKTPGQPGSPHKPLLPYMQLRRERTEMVSYNDQTFMVHLPSIVEIEELKMKKYNIYCNVGNQSGKPVNDRRFQKVLQTLSPNKTRLRRSMTDFVQNPKNRKTREIDDNDSVWSSERTEGGKSRSPTRKHGRKVTIVFPSRSGTAVPSTQGPKSAPDLNKAKIMEDLKTKDLRELQDTYGTLAKTRLKGGKKSAASRTSSEKSYKSGTLQLIFSVQSNVK